MTTQNLHLPILRPLRYSLLLEPDGKVLEIRLRVPDSPAAEKVLMLLAECGEIVLDVSRHPVQGRMELGDA